jgi:polyphosphate:AMP phosphotransferase
VFEAVQLGQRMSKDAFDSAELQLRTRLLLAQHALAEARKPVILVVAGVDTAGKGDVVDRLNKWLDTRGIQTHAFWDSTDEQDERPYYWRFWQRLPPRGQMGIFFNAWYWDALRLRANRDISQAELDERMRRVEELESMLAQDDYLIVKLWFHIDKKQQKRRRKQRDKALSRIKPLKPDRIWQKHYNKFVAAAERAIRMTDHASCPWTLIDATDAYHRDYRAGEALLEAMERKLAENSREPVASVSQVDSGGSGLDQATVLDRVDLSATLDKAQYDSELEQYQQQLNLLGWQAYAQKRSTVLVFEGWDAAGKGGAIRRVSDALDARLCRAITTGVPSDEERAHHYLWRFWRHIPRCGFVTLYDRSWYGRVLVERVEGLARVEEWSRAYQEINDFEEQLVDRGIVVLKFWLHISKAEQLRRFEAREAVPWKRYKITSDDWRNREKWDDYRLAVNDMIRRTSTAKAPWQLVPAEDKRYARIKVMRTLCTALDQALN